MRVVTTKVFGSPTEGFGVAHLNDVGGRVPIEKVIVDNDGHAVEVHLAGAVASFPDGVEITGDLTETEVFVRATYAELMERIAR